MLKQLITIVDLLLQVARHGSLWFARLGGFLLIATVFLIVIDIITRGLLGFSFGVSTEYSGYVLAISSSLAFAHALFMKAHIRIDVVYLTLNKALRTMMDVLALLAFVAFSFVVARAAWDFALHSLSRNSLSNTPLETPLWIPQVFWSIGLTWFCIAVVLLLARVLLALLSRDMDTVQALAGSATLDDQVRNEGAELSQGDAS